MNNEAEYMTVNHLVIEMVENGFIIGTAPPHPSMGMVDKSVAETPAKLAELVQEWAERKNRDLLNV